MGETDRDKLAGNFEDFLIDELTDAEFAKEYLDAAAAEGDADILRMAKADIEKAQGKREASSD